MVLQDMNQVINAKSQGEKCKKDEFHVYTLMWILTLWDWGSDTQKLMWREEWACEKGNVTLKLIYMYDIYTFISHERSVYSRKHITIKVVFLSNFRVLFISSYLCFFLLYSSTLKVNLNNSFFSEKVVFSALDEYKTLFHKLQNVFSLQSGNLSPIEYFIWFFWHFHIFIPIHNSLDSRLHNHLSTLVAWWSSGVQDAVGQVSMVSEGTHNHIVLGTAFCVSRNKTILSLQNQ